MDLLGLDLPDALAMAAAHPAAFLGSDDNIGRIAPGFRANLALLNDDMKVAETWIDGVSSGQA